MILAVLAKPVLVANVMVQYAPREKFVTALGMTRPVYLALAQGIYVAQHFRIYVMTAIHPLAMQLIVLVKFGNRAEIVANVAFVTKELANAKTRIASASNMAFAQGGAAVVQRVLHEFVVFALQMIQT